MFRSLYGKIFLWFCLTVILGFVATILAAYLFNMPGGPQDIGPISRLNHMTAHGMARAYTEEGQPGLLDFLDSFHSDTRCTARLFDATGKELSGLPVSSKIKKAVETHLASPNPVPPKEITSRPSWKRPPGPPPGVDSMSHAHTTQSIRFSTPRGDMFVAIIQFPSPLHFIRLQFSQKPPFRLIIFLAAGFLLSYLLARYLTTPVRKLQQAARKLGHGDLSARVTDGSMNYSEFRELGHEFNRMAGRVEKLVRSQQQLIRDISHELRSPLTRMKLSLELARKRSDPVCQAELDRIEADTARLEELVGQSLAFAHMDKLEDDLELEMVNLGALLISVARDADLEAQVKNVNLAVNVKNVVMLNANTELLRRTLENILRNAVRHCPPGKCVETTLATDDSASQAIISIRDYGAGVPEEHLSELFKPFFRSESSRDRGTGGTGLGLAIAWRAVKLHGGDISVANADGGGLVVEVRLPLPA
ncbi:sensor histidine kinase [Desulfovibrio ferrophilus]|uniref:histidine kinase n=1 Tax=Desulfovibrio ferrophilus TaxID=241368 RepID=A0A2Z6AWM7_9BACT|nr:HAMP domain-containing sensor histidine kinase [Desulfovibrio ferrophilus]BBD07657.1 signal transduction histidine kinase [Desulfovibrio ferrophilus]